MFPAENSCRSDLTRSHSKIWIPVPSLVTVLGKERERKLLTAVSVGYLRAATLSVETQRAAEHNTFSVVEETLVTFRVRSPTRNANVLCQLLLGNFPFSHSHFPWSTFSPLLNSIKTSWHHVSGWYIYLLLVKTNGVAFLEPLSRAKDCSLPSLADSPPAPVPGNNQAPLALDPLPPILKDNTWLVFR